MFEVTTPLSPFISLELGSLVGRVENCTFQGLRPALGCLQGLVRGAPVLGCLQGLVRAGPAFMQTVALMSLLAVVSSSAGRKFQRESGPGARHPEAVLRGSQRAQVGCSQLSSTEERALCVGPPCLGASLRHSEVVTSMGPFICSAGSAVLWTKDSEILSTQCGSIERLRGAVISTPSTPPFSVPSLVTLPLHDHLSSDFGEERLPSSISQAPPEALCQ